MTPTTRAARHRGDSADLLDPADARDDRSSRQSRATTPSKSASPSSEKPVRRQLRNTSITGPEDSTIDNELAGDASSEAGSAQSDSRRASPHSQDNQRQPKKKRSFDEIDHDTGEADKTSGSKHLRKRSKSEEENSPLPKDDTNKVEEATAINEDKVIPEEAPKSEANVEPSQLEEVEASIEVENDLKPTSDPATGDRAAQTPPRNTTENILMDDSLPTSPPNKRTREQFANEHPEIRSANALLSLSAPTETNKDTNLTSLVDKEPASATEEPERKKSKDDRSTKAQPTKVPPSSGFSNTSAESPFSTISTSKPPEAQAQTSSSAFSSSGFASFASNSASPFGAISTSGKQPEIKPKESEDTAKPAASTSGFASLASASSPFATAKTSFGSGSPFASTPSFGSSLGFGSLGGGFAKPGVGPPLSSFASPNGTSGIIGSGSKLAKSFGTPADNDDEDEGETSDPEEYAIKTGADEDHKDPRFFEQDVETGEEGEETIYSTRAKLYVTSEKQWKERSVGVFKVNVSVEEDVEESRRKGARFIMRADGSHRVALNSPITKDIEIRDPTGGPPKGKNAIFLGFIDGQPKLMQLKMKTPQQAKEFHEAVTYLQRSM